FLPPPNSISANFFLNSETCSLFLSSRWLNCKSIFLFLPPKNTTILGIRKFSDSNPGKLCSGWKFQERIEKNQLQIQTNRFRFLLSPVQSHLEIYFFG